MLDKSAFLKLVVLLEAVFGPQDKGRQIVYLELLEDYDYNDLKVAFTRCAKELKQYPTIKDILDRLPSFVTDEIIASRVFRQLYNECEYGPYFYSPVTGTYPRMTRCNPDDIAILEQVGGVDRLKGSIDNHAATERLNRDFAKAYIISINPSRVRAEIRARNLIGSPESKVDALLKETGRQRQIEAEQDER